MLRKFDQQFTKDGLFLCTQAIEVGRIILVRYLSQKWQTAPPPHA